MLDRVERLRLADRLLKDCCSDFIATLILIRVHAKAARAAVHRLVGGTIDVEHPVAMSSAVGGVSVHEIEVGDPVSIVRRLLVHEHRLAEIWVLGITNLSFSNLGL